MEVTQDVGAIQPLGSGGCIVAMRPGGARGQYPCQPNDSQGVSEDQSTATATSTLLANCNRMATPPRGTPRELSPILEQKATPPRGTPRELSPILEQKNAKGYLMGAPTTSPTDALVVLGRPYGAGIRCDAAVWGRDYLSETACSLKATEKDFQFVGATPFLRCSLLSVRVSAEHCYCRVWVRQLLLP